MLITAATCGKDSPTKPQPVTPTATRIEVTPSSATLDSLGQTVLLTAKVLDQNNQILIGASMIWTSGNTGVATVSAQGLVTAARYGTTKITARSDNAIATIEIQVVQSAISIVLEPTSATLTSIGETVQLTAVVVNKDSQDYTNAPVIWYSGEPGIATVNDQGLVTAVDYGKVQIHAQIGDLIAWIYVMVPTSERRALTAIYNSTNGPGWYRNRNWLRYDFLHNWAGVITDANYTARDGNVIHLDLAGNNLSGSIPSEVGLLDSLRILAFHFNNLAGEIPPEIGKLSVLKTLSLSVNQLTGKIPSEIGDLGALSHLGIGDNQLTGEIPVAIGKLRALKTLHLYDNQLTGNIPPEIGNLSALEGLNLSGNQLNEIPPEIGKLGRLKYLSLNSSHLTGGIPPEIGQLSALLQLHLQTNQLIGEIPPEIGRLRTLESLWLNVNHLTGEIPPEIGQLNRLEMLLLHQNQLTGPIPPQIGQLWKLRDMSLSANRLSGPIPPEIGQLGNLQRLGLSLNQLTGSIPREIGQLDSLRYLYLRENLLTGEIPPEIGRMQNLQVLDLSGNKGLYGKIPLEIANLLNLEKLVLDDTLLCDPGDPEFDEFLRTLVVSRVPRCDVQTGSVVQLIQTTQSADYPVPLVAGKNALLRVFVSVDEQFDADMPSMLATFYQDGVEVHTVQIRAQDSKIPPSIDEGSLSASANAVVPGSIVMPGLELVVQIDPDGSIAPSAGIQSRIPATGKLAIEVLDVPSFDLNLIPLVWAENPDNSVVSSTAGLTGDEDIFRMTRDLLPVREFRVVVRDPLYTSVDPVFENRTELFQEIEAFQKVDYAGGHYMGVLSSSGGSAIRGTAVTISGFDEDTIAHELGHNLDLFHAPCGTSRGVDSYYPYPEGNIGAWGYDRDTGLMVSPDTPDLMSYCGPPDWISDYNFSRAIRHRQTDEYIEKITPARNSAAMRTLLLWGGVNEFGEITLNPSFAVDAAPAMPGESGPYRVTGMDAEDGVLFSVDFNMAEFEDAEGGVFVFALPMRRAWYDRLFQITLSGPEGVDTKDAAGDTAMALLRDRFTGQIRGFLRDLPVELNDATSVRRVLPEPGMTIKISRGVPSPADW